MLSTTYTILQYYIVRKNTEKIYLKLSQQILLSLYNDPSPYTIYCSKYSAFILRQEQKKTKNKTSSAPHARRCWFRLYKHFKIVKKLSCITSCYGRIAKTALLNTLKQNHQKKKVSRTVIWHVVVHINKNKYTGNINNINIIIYKEKDNKYTVTNSWRVGKTQPGATRLCNSVTIYTHTRSLTCTHTNTPHPPYTLKVAPYIVVPLR